MASIVGSNSIGLNLFILNCELCDSMIMYSLLCGDHICVQCCIASFVGSENYGV